ncbi:YlxQ family RNA-binding protein [Amphibacillus cookii]|uniref:YlxQ family RNA-binding protein n=1 Tax=Amphibacillus cookii TaxID=767787 RepID=UPI0019580180|nr:YlxQ family RNA-binding protein [Amphibacillus cookii]MBM7540613.1 ribosomal protein L7Ae-like RNA K-turn-binding protein [Amphibacillus cookii]
MSNEQKYLNMIGLATRARQIAVGEDQIIKAIKQRQAKLVLIANDIGLQTNKKLTDKCKFYRVPYRTIVDRDTLSHAIGKAGRVAIAITDEGFAEKICSLLD